MNGTIRLQRSRLFVPGSRPNLFEKAVSGPADSLCLDLEDSVAPGDKDKARANVVEALNRVDFAEKLLSVRINSLDTIWAHQDIIALMSADRVPDLMLIPKVHRGEDVRMVAWLCERVGAVAGHDRLSGLEAIIESAAGLANIDAIAAAHPRLESLHFGAADFAASVGMRTTGIGAAEPDYAMDTPDGSSPLDVWHYPLMRIAVAARARGLTPIDGPFGDFGDEAGFKAQARRAALMGFEGKWAIHPKQVSPANEVFTPSQAAINRATAILEAMAQAESEGSGAATFEGQLIDAASIKQAQVVKAKAERIQAKEAG
jgi:malyl-CoA/(S)-citramalyl-CoA lyase